MLEHIALLAGADSAGLRVGICAICIFVGIILIMAGRNNIRTQTAEESGKRRMVNRMMGKSNTYEGRTAVNIGRMRIVIGILIIIFGIVFIFVGPFLAN
ncbi:MAG: hypothetical protein IH991_08515 [Planctomycetes bacterium]|nr:hypothetical protein [Planctomycetota bacterium]